MKYADPRMQEMYDWFHKQFDLPEKCDLDMTNEYGYQYVCGGPYTAQEVLNEAFSGKYDDTMIEQVARELDAESFEWILTPRSG